MWEFCSFFACPREREAASHLPEETARKRGGASPDAPSLDTPPCFGRDKKTDTFHVTAPRGYNSSQRNLGRGTLPHSYPWVREINFF